MLVSRRLSVSLAVFGWAWLLLGGCGGGPTGPKLEPVTGKVTYKNKAVAGAVVAFHPIETTKGNGGEGRTGPDGTFKVKYRRGGDGLPAGKYKVVVSHRVMPDGSAPPEDVDPIESPAREMLPAVYSDENRTKLVKTVPEGGGTIDFDLK